MNAEEFVILAVDDEPEVLSNLARELRAEGHRVHTLFDADEASRYVAREPFDVVICDYDMPAVNGLELLHRARLVRPDSVRMLLTGRPSLELALEAINRGEVYRFMTKPFDPNELRLNVRLACKHLALQRENERLLREVRKRDTVLERLEQEHPGITRLNRALDGAILVDDQD